MGRLADSLVLATTAARVARDQDIKYPAAALAYYAFVSFIPLLLLVFAILGEKLAVDIYTTAPRFLTLEAQRLVYEAMTAASGRTGGGLLAIVVLVWSGANVVAGVQDVVERIENVAERPRRARLRDGLVILGSLGFAIAAIIATSTLLSLLPEESLVGIVGTAVLFVALTATFLPLYYIPSRMVTSPSAALPGALTAALGWTLLLTAIQLYAANAGRYAIYGVLSGVIIIFTSLYIAAGVVMFGIIVNAILADDIDALHSYQHE